VSVKSVIHVDYIYRLNYQAFTAAQESAVWHTDCHSKCFVSRVLRSKCPADNEITFLSVMRVSCAQMADFSDI